MNRHSEKQDMKEEEEQVRREAKESSKSQALANEMQRDMQDKSPGEAIKHDMKAVGQDIKDSLSGSDKDEEEEGDDSR